MFKGLLWYLMWAAVALGAAALAIECFAGTDTANFSWSHHEMVSEDLVVEDLVGEPALLPPLTPEGYTLMWGNYSGVYTHWLQIPDPEVVDGKVTYTATNLPPETIYFVLYAWASNPDPRCSPARLNSSPTYEITRYVGPPINPKIPQDGKVDGVIK